MGFERRPFQPRDAAAWQALVAALAAWFDGQQVPEDLRYSAELVLDEWLSNLLLHGERDGSRPVQAGVSAEWSAPASLVLHLDDDAEAFDPTRLTDPPASMSLDDTAVGGLGWRLIRKRCAGISYRRDDARNVLRLHLQPRP